MDTREDITWVNPTSYHKTKKFRIRETYCKNTVGNNVIFSLHFRDQLSAFLIPDMFTLEKDKQFSYLCVNNLYSKA